MHSAVPQWQAAEHILKLVRNPNVSLNGDDLIDKATDGKFDFAFMYNGDAATANTLRDEEEIGRASCRERV